MSVINTWKLDGETLEAALIDDAEKALQVTGHEGYIKVTLVGDEFVCEFVAE